MSEKVIQNQLVIIEGLPWRGKTFFMSFMASFYPYIWSNVELFRNWKKINNTIWKMSVIETIPFMNQKWLIVIDEAWVNVSSRKFYSEENAIFSRLGMLGRKLNKDIIFIAQISRTVDVNIRELAVYKFDMHSWFIDSNRLMFEYTVKDRFDNILWTKEVDLTLWAEQNWFSYNTIENSVIVDTKKSKKKKIQVMD